MKNINKILPLILLISFGLTTPSFAVRDINLELLHAVDNNKEGQVRKILNKSPLAVDDAYINDALLRATTNNHTGIVKLLLNTKRINAWHIGIALQGALISGKDKDLLQIILQQSIQIAEQSIKSVDQLDGQDDVVKLLNILIEYNYEPAYPIAIQAVQQAINNNTIDFNTLALLESLLQRNYEPAFGPTLDAVQQAINRDCEILNALSLFIELVLSNYQPAIEPAYKAAQQYINSNDDSIRHNAQTLLETLPTKNNPCVIM